MPRRSGRSGGGGGMMGRAPAPVRRAPPPVPAHPPPSAPMAAPTQPRQPGMFAQMATTAAGVAVGSAVGHTIGHAMTGGGGGGGAQEMAPVQPAAAPVAQQSGFDPNNPCSLQLKQFLECTQTQSDLSLCSGFNSALKECKMFYGVQ